MSGLSGKKMWPNGLYIVCVLWVGGWGGQSHRPYGVDWVYRLHDMVKHNTSYDFTFVCLSNLSDNIKCNDEIQVVPLINGWKVWWNKIEVFRPGLFPEGARVLYLDLDNLIVGDLDPMIEYPSEFALFSFWSFSKYRSEEQAIRRSYEKRGCRAVPRYSTCAFVMDAGVRSQLYSDFSALQMFRLCGDQDWVGDQLEDEAIFPQEWGRNLVKKDRGDSIDPKGAKILACRQIKNHQLWDHGYFEADRIWRGDGSKEA